MFKCYGKIQQMRVVLPEKKLPAYLLVSSTPFSHRTISGHASHFAPINLTLAGLTFMSICSELIELSERKSSTYVSQLRILFGLRSSRRIYL